MIGASTKAGQLFRCTVCGESFPEDNARFDEQLGPVCPDCLIQIRWSVAWMKQAGITRPFNTNDITPDNHKRHMP